MAISLCFDGHVRNVGSLGLDLFVTFTVASATELPADTVLTMVLDKWGRRWLACGSMVMGGVFSLLATAVPTGECLYITKSYWKLFCKLGSYIFFPSFFSIWFEYYIKLLPHQYLISHFPSLCWNLHLAILQPVLLEITNCNTFDFIVFLTLFVPPVSVQGFCIFPSFQIV